MRTVVAACVAALISSGCSPPPPAEPAPAPREADRGPAWQDVFDGTPDLYVVVRPRAFRRDAVFGAFWKSLMSAAESKGLMRGPTIIEAIEGSDEVIAGVGARESDAAIVLRGVPASLDPARISDAKGRPFFKLLSDRTRIVEYGVADEGGGGAKDGRLFVLPDRSWVGVLGGAKERAVQAFVTPMHRPIPKVDAAALATLRVSGPLAHVLDRSPTFGGLEKKLTSATFSLMPDKGGIVVALAYADAGSVAWAENEAKRLLADLTKRDPRLAFLSDAVVRYEGTTVYARLSIPPQLLKELPFAKMTDFFGEF